jgi:hypothetical protein
MCVCVVNRVCDISHYYYCFTLLLSLRASNLLQMFITNIPYILELRVVNF